MATEAEKSNDKYIDEILSRLLVSAYKIEEKSIWQNSGKTLTISEMHVLCEIPGERPKTMSQVADGLMISVGALTTAIDKLTEKGYVKRFRGKTDRRTMKIMLTPKGKDAYKKHQEFHKLMVGEAIGDLDESEKELLVQILRKVDAFFVKEGERCL